MGRNVKVTLLMLIYVLLFANTTVVNAEAESNNEVTYNLEVGGTQEFTIVDEDGEHLYVTIEEVESAPVTRVAAGTYKITYKRTLAWNAGFYAVISNNNITSVKDPFYTVYYGSITNTRLLRESTKKASYYFNYQAGISSTSTGVRATISGTSLKTSLI